MKNIRKRLAMTLGVLLLSGCMWHPYGGYRGDGYRDRSAPQPYGNPGYNHPLPPPPPGQGPYNNGYGGPPQGPGTYNNGYGYAQPGQ